MDKIVGWLWDQCSDGSSVGCSPQQPFHFFAPWLAFCVIGLVVAFYYRAEGRRRFFGRNALNRYVLDHLTGQWWPLALVGLLLIGARYAQMALFGYRLWRYLWLAWAACVFGYWAYFMIVKYRGHLKSYRDQQTYERYLPPSKTRRRRAVRA